MIRIVFKCTYQGVLYSCYFYVNSVISRPHNTLLVCTTNSSISDTFVISSFKQFHFLYDQLLVVLSPYYYNILVRNILDMGVYIFGAVAVPVKTGVKYGF